jgi:hypothetical protein
MISEAELARIADHPTVWDVGPLLFYVKELLQEQAAARAEVEALKEVGRRLESDLEGAHADRIALQKELAASRAENERLRELVRECRAHIKDAGHLSPSCEHFGVCELNACGMDDLLQRIEAELGES